MPPRKPRATPKKASESATPAAVVPDTASKKRKVDWSTIDEHKKPFEGFKLTAVKTKTAKKTSQAGKRQKTTKPATGVSEGYRDAPLDADIVQRNPFPESDLSQTHYKVTPAGLWESTLRYRKFTISEAEFEVGQTIFIQKEDDEFDSGTDIKHWIGRVLEVRAGDAAHVYLRVYWLYRPEDLPGGREPHHGSSELIASNHMDIIEALTVVDRANVIHWDEDPEKPWPHPEQLFWRQTLDLQKKPVDQQLSKLRTFCVDEAPCNPDEPIVQCPSCSEWLHGRCLEKKAVQDALDEQTKDQAGKGKLKAVRTSTSSGDFTAQYVELGGGKICLTVTDKRPGQKKRRWNVDVDCLMCHALIEKAAVAIPTETKSTSKSKTYTRKSVAAKAEEQIALPSREIPAQPDLPITPEEVDEDPLVGQDEDVPDVALAPAEPPPVPKPNAPRGRGRPRKYPRIEKSIVYDTIKSEPALAKPILGKRSASDFDTAKPVSAKRRASRTSITKDDGAEDRAAKRLKVESTAADLPAVALTPAPLVSVNENVFQSGIRSVKRLLWRAS